VEAKVAGNVPLADRGEGKAHEKLLDVGRDE
jgi:hypothetical protein